MNAEINLTFKPMPHCLTLLFIGLFMVLPLSPSRAEAEKIQSGSGNDVRILLDVSGSMKRNDPENLRIPALKLLLDLLPGDARAGVWMFSEKVSELVPVADAKAEWKAKALKASEHIHSRGVLTDIEAVLKRALKAWQDAPGKRQRQLLLLTDGVVDVSKDFMLSADSRERIINELIPALQQSKIQVYTIALSDNADSALLEKLAIDTGGWHKTAKTAGQLPRVFLKIFNKVMPRESVPIQDNKFTIDDSIKEFSILLFSKASAPPVKLLTPEQQTLTAADTGGSIHWRKEKNYDLVTVAKPAAGEWQIITAEDPDNQVMIVTDLKLLTNALPNHLDEGEAVEVQAHFTDKKQLLTRRDFLDLISLRIVHTNTTGKTMEQPLQPVDDKPGFYHIKLAQPFAPGIHKLQLVADGKTFKRVVVHTLEVLKTPIRVVTEVLNKQRQVKVQLIPDAGVIDSQYMRVRASLARSGGKTENITVTPEKGVWVLLVKVQPGEQIMVNFSVLAKSLQGNPLTPNLRPISIDDQLFEKPDAALPDGVQNKVQKPTADQGKPTVDRVDDAPEIQAVNWLKTSTIVAGINIFMAVCGYFLWRFLKKSNAKKQTELLDRLS